MADILSALFSDEKNAGQAHGAGDQAWLSEIFAAGRQSSAGIAVTSEKAFSVSAYYAALRAISEDLAKLPLPVLRRMEPRGRERVPEHPVYRLLNSEPNPEMSAMSFRETLTHWALGWGNGPAEIEFDNAGRPRALWPIHPSRFVPSRVGQNRFLDDRQMGLPAGALYYAVRNPNGTWTGLPPEQVFNLHGLGGDGVTGYSVLRFAAESLGLAIAAQEFGARFFGNGASAGVVIKHPGKMSDLAFQHFRESWAERHGGVEKSHRPAVLEEGITIEKMTIPPEEAQFLQTRQFQIEEIARWFRMPPHKLQHLLRATFSNITSQALEYVVDTLLPWAVRWEQEVQRRLFTPAEKGVLYVKHIFAALLRGSPADRANYYRGLSGVGALSPNDIRELEDLNPVEGGDDYYVPLNMGKLTAPPKEPAPPPAPPPALPAPPPEPEEEAAAAVFNLAAGAEGIFRAEIARLLRREEKMAARGKLSAKDTATIDSPERQAQFVESLLPAARYFAMQLTGAGVVRAGMGADEWAEPVLRTWASDNLTALRGLVSGKQEIQFDVQAAVYTDDLLARIFRAAGVDFPKGA